MTAATYKSTALKVLVLWNLPALILLAGAFEIGTSVIAQDLTMDMNPFKPFIQHCEDFYGKMLALKDPLNKLYLKLRLTKATV